jgi:hypothetical protein
MSNGQDDSPSSVAHLRLGGRQQSGHALQGAREVRRGLLERHAILGAFGKEIVVSPLKPGLQSGDGFTMKIDAAANTQNTTDENAVTFVVCEVGGLAPVRHGIHGFAPACSRSSRASKWPVSWVDGERVWCFPHFPVPREMRRARQGGGLTVLYSASRY